MCRTIFWLDIVTSCLNVSGQERVRSVRSVQCNYVLSGLQLKVERTLLSYILDIFISVVSLPSIYQWIVWPKKMFPLRLISFGGKD